MGSDIPFTGNTISFSFSFRYFLRMLKAPTASALNTAYRIVHGYEDIRLSVVRETAKHDIKELESSLKEEANIM